MAIVCLDARVFQQMRIRWSVSYLLSTLSSYTLFFLFNFTYVYLTE
jgi:hypothetical protein